MKLENYFEDVAMNEQRRDVAREFSVSARPVVAAAWRGRFCIPNQNLDIHIAAQVSNKACSEVLEAAGRMPESLCLEMIRRFDVWPASFKSSPPNEDSVSLLFFSEGRDEEVLDNLLTYAIYGDFALKSVTGKAELLIFTSLQLPPKLQRFQGKFYFWGVFKGQRASEAHQSDYHAPIQTFKMEQSLSPNSGNIRRFEGNGSPILISSKDSSKRLVADGDKVERRGRHLDAAWEHAKPLDFLRQKAECIHCGFVSSHGGISRLKAHLGGGHPKIRLLGCPKVPPEVKKLMADWFSEWSKNTKALWTKEIKAEPAAHGGRPHDASWEESKPSDVASQKTDNKYFGFVSLGGLTSHHKAHFGGGDPNMQMEGCPEGDKNVTASSLNKCQADSVQGEKKGRPLDVAWEHGQPLDEARQKTRCNYCGFVSLFGGISRLKAHLGGGCPQMQLQGCPRVSLEVKRVMEQWFNEWKKNSMAAWTRKSHGAPAKPSNKRKRPLEDTWEHAIPLDETGQATKCRYCGSVCNRGGIARLKAHLGGGDPATQLEGCPNVPLGVKSSMAKEKKKYRKKSKGVAAMETVGGTPVETQRTANEAHWFEKRHDVLQETLDEMTNTSVKERLQKLLGEKSDNLQKMQFEIQSLQSQLDSMP